MIILPPFVQLSATTGVFVFVFKISRVHFAALVRASATTAHTELALERILNALSRSGLTRELVG